MFPSKIGSSSIPTASASRPSNVEKRSRESSSEEDRKSLIQPNQLSASIRPALAKRLRGQVAGAEEDAHSTTPMLPGPFNVQERIFDNDTSEFTPVFRLATPHGSGPLAAKIRGDSPGDSPTADERIDPLTHSVQQYQKIGHHPNLNRIHGFGTIEVDGVKTEALIMDAGDMSLHTALDVLEQARADGALSDKDYFGVVLPSLARAMIGAGAHCAAAGVEHRDITSVNLLMFRDGRPPQLIDLGLSRDHADAAPRYWPDTEVAAGNPFSALYPGDSASIARTLHEAGASASDGGMGLDSTTTPPSAELRSLQRLLASADPRQEHRRTPQAHDFEFLTLGTDAQAGEILRGILQKE